MMKECTWVRVCFFYLKIMYISCYERRLMEKGYGKVYYPSLPLGIQLERKSDREIMLSLENKLLMADFKEFLYQLIESGRSFIEFLKVITGRPDDR